MKRQDLVVILICLAVLSLFVFVEPIKEWFLSWSGSKDWRYFVMAFLKFGILATFGECIGLRISKGVYNQKGFGIIPRALVWGVLGIFISIAMGIFSRGVFGLFSYFGTDLNSSNLNDFGFGIHILYAFLVSVFMNTFFAPVFMTFHKITDTHIIRNGGTLRGFFHSIDFSNIIQGLDWKTQWNFVFKRTIPLFWYPAHTITFLLPKEYQVLFAALLGVALGIILSIANSKKNR